MWNAPIRVGCVQCRKIHDRRVRDIASLYYWIALINCFDQSDDVRIVQRIMRARLAPPSNKQALPITQYASQPENECLEKIHVRS